jgi:hypothetical protein
MDDVIHTNLYISHENEELLAKLADALSGAAVDKEKAYSIVKDFDPSRLSLADELFKHKYVTRFEFEPGADEEHGYHILQLRQREGGESSTVHFIEFLYALIPGIQALAWGYDEDESWEYFIKYENGRAIKQEHIPWEDRKMDQNAIEYIYHWWHEDLPDEIEAGLLNGDEDDYDGEDEEDERFEFNGDEFDEED